MPHDKIKDAARRRMAETGEPYTVARRKVTEEHQTPAHLWPCGCLRNDAGAHRVSCPDHPEGVRG